MIHSYQIDTKTCQAVLYSFFGRFALLNFLKGQLQPNVKKVFFYVGSTDIYIMIAEKKSKMCSGNLDATEWFSFLLIS